MADLKTDLAELIAAGKECDAAHRGEADTDGMLRREDARARLRAAITRIHDHGDELLALAQDAERYRVLRNGLSDWHGDCYAMTFDSEGDYPVVGADLDNRVDRMIERAAIAGRAGG